MSKMQEELEMMRPLLEEAAKDTVVTMEKIKVPTPHQLQTSTTTSNQTVNPKPSHRVL